MELEVKALSPSASGWQGDAVTNWNPAILLHNDVWETTKLDRTAAYYRAPVGEDSTLYMSQDVDSGYSTFWLDNPQNRNGMGGREFNLEMWDGSTAVLRGPWSSNSSVVNWAIDEDAFEDDPQFEHIREVSYYSHDWRSVGLAAAMAVPHLRLLVEEFMGPQWHLAWGTLGERAYVELHAPHADSYCEGRIT